MDRFGLGRGIADSSPRWQFQQNYREGLRLLQQGSYFEAHEKLEEVWRGLAGQERQFLQGLIQIAVALHHNAHANREGATSLLSRAAQNLANCPARYGLIDVDLLRATISHWRTALDTGQPLRVLEFQLPVTNNTMIDAPIPMLDLRRQFARIRTEVMQAIESVCESQYFILGEQVAGFEREAASFLGAQQGVGCASGTDALWLALLAVGVEPGDVVATTPFTFFATVSSIVRAGARPVLADVDAGTLNLDPAQVERKLQAGGRMRAVLPVHLYGQCADMDAFKRLAGEYDFKIVEDAAQAFGAKWDGQHAGALGDAAAFSFYPTKNLSAYGDAGCVTTCDEATAERAIMLRNHGMRQRYLHEAIGANSRLDAIQGAVLRVKLKYIDQWNQARRERAAIYDRLLAESGLQGKADTVSKENPVRLLTTRPEAYHIYHQYVVRTYRRDELRQFLADRKIGTEVYYPIPLHLQPCFAYLGYKKGDLPVAEQAAEEVLALPVFPELTEDEQKRVVAAIAEFYS
jgi:dTDP-4-amino-4,6-dideoxygalactose transaminase